MTDDQETLQRLQQDLEDRRRRRPQPKRRPIQEGFTPEQLERLPELRRSVHSEVAELFPGFDDGLLEAAIDLRARQLLREEIDPDWKARHEREALEAKEEAFKARLAGYRFPEKVIKALWTDRDQNGKDLYVTDAQAWLAEGWARGLQTFALVGMLGTGKTFAACRVVGKSGDEGSVVFATAREVFNRSDRYDPDRPFLKRIEESKVLILDETGTDEEKDTDSSQLANLFHSRFEQDRRTIVIANMPKREFAKRYGDAVMSRIYESGGLHHCAQVVRRGEQRRQEQMDLIE